VKKYQPQADPTRVPHEMDWAWVAGFLEGEGSFCPMSGHDKRARVSANQKEIEPLERLLELFGGRIYRIVKNRPNAIYVWMLRGERARVFLQTLLPMMCSRRRNQIQQTLEATFSVEHGSAERYAQHSEIVSRRKHLRNAAGQFAATPFGVGGCDNSQL